MNREAASAVMIEATKTPVWPLQNVTPPCQPMIADIGPNTSMLRMLA